jgi:class 3 adenylate cyclase/TolB-like protein
MPRTNDAIEALLEQRQQIDRALGEQQRNLVVMFTDIVGSTQYFERKGDIEGIALLKRHNGLLFPIVERHGGRVIKTIGDAIMAVFESETEGVRCAMAMHRALSTETRRPGQEPIHIRIGLHAGPAFTVNDDVFGDTVNTASRVAHEAKADEIVVSRSLAGRLEGIATVERGSVALKGKAEPLALSSVPWTGPEAVASAGNDALFVLEIARGPSGLKVSAHQAESATVQAYGETPFGAAELDATSAEFARFGPAPAESYRERLRELGGTLFGRLPEGARQRLAANTLSFLKLQLDDALVHVPWELMHDGTDFLALRCAIGRTVAARLDEAPTRASAGTHALVVANPTGDLPAAAREGRAVAGLLRDGFGGEVRLLEGPVTRAQFAQALRGCALVHIAGHVRSTAEGAGLLLSDGVLGPGELAKLVGGAAPRLVFVNGCFATDARGLARGMSDVGSALLLGGVAHFLGPFLEISDADAQTFALRFYEHALAGRGLGDAVLHARRALRSAGAPTAFGAYVLYGDPRHGLPAGSVRLASPSLTRSSSPAPAKIPAPPVRRGLPLVPIIAGVAVAAAAGAAFLLTRPKPAAPTPAPVVVATRPAPVAVEPVHAASVQPEPATGPIRLCVLPFKNVSGDASLAYLKDAIAESITTDFGHHAAFRLIENTQINLDIDYLEQSQTKYVDPATRAKIGKIAGAEVVVLGAYQRAGKRLRANARFVNVATGEILDSVREDEPEAKVLELQDRLAEDLNHTLDAVARRMRP